MGELKLLKFINGLTDRVLKGGAITFTEALRLAEITKQKEMVFLFGFANQIREEFQGSVIDLCAIVNAKSGSCSEDCTFCSQSAHHRTKIVKYPLLSNKDIIEKAKDASSMGANRFSIVVSGKDINNPKELFLGSPFPKENRLSIIIPKTSTRFTSRSQEMWKEIASYIAKAADLVPGNVASFFPSYYLLKQVKNYLQTMTKKTVITEDSGMTREEKHEMLERFKSYKKTGALLLGVITGNFGKE